MSNDLLTKLGEKIQSAIETIELLKLENEELKGELAEVRTQNALLQEEKEEWDHKLTALIEQFENFEQEEAKETEAITASYQTEEEEDLLEEEEEGKLNAVSA